jgi:hypothetical protein
MVPARGVSVLSKLGLVKIWWHPGLRLIFISVPWWKQERGQSVNEYALLLGIGGVLAWGLWSMLGLTVTEAVRLVLSVIAPGSDWLFRG